jgi:sulfate transport system permease protein
MLAAASRRRQPSQLPGFAPTCGLAVGYVLLLVALPLGWLLVRVLAIPWPQIAAVVAAPRTLAALRLSIGCAVTAALVNVVLGIITAWALTRYRFPGRGLFDALLDLPFALPTSVAGITLVYLYAEHGPLGRWLARAGVQVAFTPLGITVALIFVGLPFVVRTVQPVVAELDEQVDQAAHLLGASPWQRFWRVQFPLLVPAALTGFALSLARGIGEYGSVLFISGNLPLRTEIAPLLVVGKLEQYDYDGASIIAALMLLTAVLLLGSVHALERWGQRRLLGSEVAP